MTLSEWGIISFKIVSYFIRLLYQKVMNKYIYISTFRELRQSIKTNYIFAAEQTINNLREALRNNKEENAFNDQTNLEPRKTCKTFSVWFYLLAQYSTSTKENSLTLLRLLPLNFILPLRLFTNHQNCVKSCHWANLIRFLPDDIKDYFSAL